MERTSVQKLARALRVMVIIVFACNIITLYFVPLLAVVQWASTGGCTVGWGLDMLQIWRNPELMLELLRDPEMRSGIFVWIWYMLISSWDEVFHEAYVAVLTLFFGTCGICTAFILWQGKRVLDTVLKGKPFSMENSVNLKQAAVCCFVISGAALARLVWGLIYYASLQPLLTYNALFVPIFLMAGLLCMVLSALFRQAAELKAENDLTI